MQYNVPKQSPEFVLATCAHQGAQCTLVDKSLHKPFGRKGSLPFQSGGPFHFRRVALCDAD
jgi:hypothetical protein